MTIAKQLSAAVVGSLLAVLAAGKVAQAITITASTTGFDSGGDAVLNFNSFFGVSFDEGLTDLHITSFIFDLSPDADGFFDENGVVLLGSPLGGGVPTLGAASSLSGADIEFELLNGGKQLKANLLTDAFDVGKSLTFGVDTDEVGIEEIPIPVMLGSNNVEVNIDTGSDFGQAGVIFSVELSDGTTQSATFQVTNDVEIDDIIDGINSTPPNLPEPAPQSIAIVDIPNPQTVPEPTSSLVALLTALGAGSTLKGRREN